VFRSTRRPERGAVRTPVLLMGAGGAVLVIALLFVLFGRGSKKSDSTTALANRCAFPACRAAYDPGQGRGYEGESVAVDPKDENHIVVTDANMSAGECTWHVTFNRGKDWTDGVFQAAGYTGCHINGPSGGHVPTGPQGVAFGPSGVVYATYGSASPDDARRESVIVATSTDGGKTFHTSVAARPAGDVVAYARPLLSVAPTAPGGKDRVLITFWQCRPTGQGTRCDTALLVRSDDGAGSFTQPITINDPPAGQTPSAALQTPDGTVFVTFLRRYADGSSDLVLAKSTDAGSTFTYSPIDSEPSIGDKYDPGKIAFDPKTNTLWAIYSDQRVGSQQLFLRKSADQGKTWGPPTGIAPDQNPTQTGTSRTPSINIAPDGRIDIVYYRSPQADTDNVYWAYSVDGGNRFLTRQVNDKPIQRFNPGFNDAIGTWYPPAVASLDDAAYVAWSDTQDAVKQNANAQDVFLRRMLPAGSDIPP
jgi:hypothetical protein